MVSSRLIAATHILLQLWHALCRDLAATDPCSLLPLPFPLGRGLSLRNTTRALLMTYVWMPLTSIILHTSCTRTTLW